MSVRKRTWTSKGIEKSAWVVDYTDGKGKRRLKTFERKKEADEFFKRAGVEVLDGLHVADAETVTFEEAGRLWIKTGTAAGLERTTLDQRRQHLELHIIPFIGDVRLNKTTVPWVRSFQEDLRAAGRSADMVKRVTVSLGSIIADAQDRGLAIRNPVHERSKARSAKSTIEKRTKKKLIVGRDIPSRDEIKAFLGSLKGSWRPMLLTAVFTGMRSSELRGLRWQNVDLDARCIHVRERADAYNTMGNPKSEAGDRTIPIPPMVVNALREWQMACPRRATGEDDASGNPIKILEHVFPNGAGKVENHGNIINRGLVPAMIAAGVTAERGERDDEGRPIVTAKYTGLHALRHFYASWLINPVSAGGMGLTPKAVQERLGHSNIATTLDVYGHLFEVDDDGRALEMAAASLIS